jgi:Protein of unknown function (DUF938)
LDVFKKLFPPTGEVLELASGSGAHINYFAPHFKQHRFQPSDYDTDVFETIKTTRNEQGNKNVADPVKIDLTEPETWPDPDAKLYDVQGNRVKDHHSVQALNTVLCALATKWPKVVNP